MEINENLQIYINNLISRYPRLAPIKQNIINAYLVLEETYRKGGKLMIAGNGGSASDSEHIAGELMKRFIIERKIDEGLKEKLKLQDKSIGKELSEKLEAPLTALPLVEHEAMSTAYLNDVDGNLVFAQQLLGFGRENDTFLGITTSGNSKNIIYAATLAKALGIKVVGLTGKDGGKLANIADVSIIAPEDETYKIQELHLPIYHCLCMMLEYTFFGENVNENQ